MKKILSIVSVLVSVVTMKGQVLFADDFNTLTLQNDVQVIGSKTITTTYTNVPSLYNVINDGFKNNVGSNNAPNKPFNVVSLKTTGWATLYNDVEKDTFLVSTSWLDTTAAAARFVVTPVINNITANSVLSWDAKSPDPVYTEGYEVYVTTNTTGTLTASSFALSDRVFYVADGNTIGAGEKNVWTKHGISLAAYAGQNVRVAFKDISTGMFQLWVDNIKVEENPNNYDAGLSEGSGAYKYNTVNTSGNIVCKVTNFGKTPITSITLNYAIKGPSNFNYTQGFGLSNSIALLASSGFTFNVPYNISTPGYYKTKVWVNYVNGNLDQNHLNDTIYSDLCIMTASPAKAVMVEQFLSAFDGYSVDGQEKLKSLASASVIAVNIHDGDSLRNSSMAGVISAYRKNTSSAVIDRNYFYDINTVAVDRPAYTSRITQRETAVVPATVSVTATSYNSTSRVLTFTVQSNFVAETMGDYRLNAYITENNVAGIGSDTTLNGWNQLNFMYNTPWSAYYQLGYYSSAANGYILRPWEYYHQNVLDTALDGSFGSTGTIPMTGGTLNQTYTKAYTYTLPVAAPGVFRYNADNMYIVANVSEYNSDVNKRNILNCTQTKVTSNTEMVSVKENNLEARFALFPNPSYGLTNVLIPENAFKKPVTITILDVLGKTVYQQPAELRFGLLQLNLYHLENGTYFIQLGDGTATRTEKLIISK